MKQETMASAEPYANHLHLIPGRQQQQPLITQFFYRPDAVADAQQTGSKHWRQIFWQIYGYIGLLAESP